MVYCATVALSAGIGVAIGASRQGRWVELRAYDLRFALRGALPATELAPITILAIDERSLGAIPKPIMFWHRELARVLESLVPARAAVVGVDLLFANLRGLDPGAEEALSRSLLRAGAAGMPLVLAYHVRASGVDQPPDFVRLAALAAGHVFGFANLTTDPDDFVRRQHLAAYGTDDRAQPSFAFAITAAYARRRQRAVPPADETMLINFRGPDHFPIVSFAGALDAAANQDAGFFERHFRDRIVLVGRIGEPGDEDLHSTPQYFWRTETPMGRSARTPGVEIHAHAITTLLEGRPIRRVSPRWVLLTAVSVAALAALACFTLKPALALPASALLLSAYGVCAVSWLFAQGWWLPVVEPAAAGLLAAGLAETANFQLEGREKRRLRNLFKRYVDDAVIERIVVSPERILLEGERKTVAVLFADIRDFTTRSERHDAEEVVADLNQYFGAVVPAIQGRGGMVDKFIGDGIMAIFGAPIEDPDAALHAVEAAEAMLAAVDALNARLAADGSEPIRIGIAVHTGQAVVGNIGTSNKMEYTAIGDVVNVAARVEGLNRGFGTELLVTGETIAAGGGRIEGNLLGEEKLKGRTGSVAVYAIARRRNGDPRS